MGAGNFAVYTAFKAKDGVSPVFKNMIQGANAFGNKLGGLQRAANGLRDIFKITTLASTALWAGLTGYAGVATKTTIDYAKEVKKMQRLTGAGIADASKMTAIGQRFGVNADGMSKALRKLTISAQKGSKELKSYGLRVNDTHGNLLPAPKLLEVVADKYKKLGGGLKGAAFAQKLMGRSAMEMVPILEKGSSGIHEMYQQAERMGLVLSEDTMKSLAKYLKAQKDVKQVMTGIQIAIGSKVLPYFAQLGEKAEVFIQKFNFKQVGIIVDSAFNGISITMKTLQPVFDKFNETFQYLSEHLFPVFVSAAPKLQMLFSGVFIPGIVMSIDALNRLFVVIDNTYNFIKSNFIPVISLLAGVLSGLALYKTVQFFQALRVQMALASLEGGIFGTLAKGQIITALESLGIAIWGSVKAIWAQNAALLSNPLFWIPATIGAVIAGIVLLWKNWDYLTAAIGNWSAKTTSWLSIFWVKVQEIFSAVGGFIKAHFTDALLSSLGAIGWVILGLKNIGGALGNIKGGQFPSFNHKNNVQPKTSVTPRLVNNQLTPKTSGAGGVVEIRNIVENKNNSRISSSSSILSAHHSMTLVPSH